MDDDRQLGPLRWLVGTWEGGEGHDQSYANAEDAVLETAFRERTTFSPFGPVENGHQVLHGLDYRTAAWRGDEENPFHTEVGYWLWDAEEGQVMRCFTVPRGVVVLAGGTASADDRSFTLRAELGSSTYGILSNRYLDRAARSVRYEVTVRAGDGTFSYDETTVVVHQRAGQRVLHTDRNTLRRTD